MSKTLCTPIGEGSVIDTLLNLYTEQSEQTSNAQILRELALLGLATWLESEEGRAFVEFMRQEFPDLLREFEVETGAPSDNNKLVYWIAQREVSSHGGSRAGAGRKRQTSDE